MGLFDWFDRKDSSTNSRITPQLPPLSFHDKMMKILDDLAVDIRRQSRNISPETYSVMRRIDDALRRVLTEMKDKRITPEHEYDLQATATDYLPEALRLYLDIPSSQRGENTPAEISLMHQYETLYLSVLKLEKMIHDQAILELKSHASFIENRFS